MTHYSMLPLTSNPCRCGIPTTACCYVRCTYSLPIHTTPRCATMLPITSRLFTQRLNHDYQRPSTTKLTTRSQTLLHFHPRLRTSATMTRANLSFSQMTVREYIITSSILTLLLTHLAPYPPWSETKIECLETAGVTHSQAQLIRGRIVSCCSPLSPFNSLTFLNR